MFEFDHEYRKQVIDALKAQYQDACDHGRCVGGMIIVDIDVAKGIHCHFYMGRKSLEFFQDDTQVRITNVADVLMSVDAWIKKKYPSHIQSESAQVCISQGRMSGKCSYILFEHIRMNLRTVGWSSYDYTTCQFELNFDPSDVRNVMEIDQLMSKGVIAV